MPTLAELTLLSTLARRLEARLGAECVARAAIAKTDLPSRIAARRAAGAALTEARRRLALMPPEAAGTAAARRCVGRELEAVQADLDALRAERAKSLKHVRALLIAADRAAPIGALPFRAAGKR